MESELEIERKLNIQIRMPQTCYICNREIVKRNGNDKDSLCFHSVDEDHENWSMLNKISVHRGCHMSYHLLNELVKNKHTVNIPTLDDRVIKILKKYPDKDVSVNTIRQYTGWSRDTTIAIVRKMVEEGKIKDRKVMKGGKTYIFYLL